MTTQSPAATAAHAVSEKFAALWDAFIDALPECEEDGPHQACPVDEMERLEAAAHAIAAYVARIEYLASHNVLG